MPGRPNYWIIHVVRQGPTALAVGARGYCLDPFFSPLYIYKIGSQLI